MQTTSSNQPKHFLVKFDVFSNGEWHGRSTFVIAFSVDDAVEHVEKKWAQYGVRNVMAQETF